MRSRIEAMKRVTLGAFLLAADPAVQTPQVVGAQEPSRARVQPDPGQLIDHITKAVLADNTVWLLDINGRLSHVPLDSMRLVPDTALGTVLDFGVDRKKRIVAVVGQSRVAFVSRRDARGQWHVDGAQLPMRDTTATAITIVSASDPITLLTAEAIYTQQGRSWQRRQLVPALDLHSVQRSVAVSSDGSVYVGTNVGEWGGTLWRVSGGGLAGDRAQSVATARIARSSALPVTGVAQDPEHSACVIASMGLLHMLELGGIVRVCGDSATVLFEQLCPRAAGIDTVDGARLARSCRLAVFAIAPSHGGFWAATSRELVRFHGHEIAERLPMPSFKNIGGIPFAVASPGLVIVRTNINWSVSLSGPTPLILSEP